MDQEPAFIRLTVPLPSRPDPHRAETVEALDHMLGQYADFDWHDEGAPHGEAPQPGVVAGEPGAAEDLRGKLVLMDEQTGEVVGELPNRVNIKEDPALAQAFVDAMLAHGYVGVDTSRIYCGGTSEEVRHGSKPLRLSFMLLS